MIESIAAVLGMFSVLPNHWSNKWLCYDVNWDDTYFNTRI